MKRLLLGSGGIRTEQRKATMVEQMQRHFGNAAEILFVPYAIADHDDYVAKIVELGFNAGYPIRGIHTCDDPVDAINQAHAIYVGGGNTFRLTNDLHRLGLIEPIRRRVLNGDLPYMGVSAGTNVACPTMMTTNDMPIVLPPSFTTCDLVPFQINAHFFAGQTMVKLDDGTMIEHCGETRDDRLREFHEMNDTPVIGLWEGSFLVVEGDTMSLIGGAARVFHRGQAPVDIQPGAILDGTLNLQSSAANV